MSFFPPDAFAPAFTWDSREAEPAQFAAQHLAGSVSRSRAGRSVANYGRLRASAGGEYGPDGIWRAGGKYTPGAEGPPQAPRVSGAQQVEDSGSLQPPPPGDDGYDPTAGGQFMPDEGGGGPPPQAAGQQPVVQATPPRPRPLRERVIDYPYLGDEPEHQVQAGMAWLRQPTPPLPHHDDEHAWASMGLSPETLPGALLHSLGNRGHKFGKWFGKGVAQILGDDAGIVSQVPIQKAFLYATLHPDIQDHFRRHSRDPLGKSINGSETAAMRTLTRAVNTLKDDPGFGQDYGRAAALSIMQAMQPPPNPDLQFSKEDQPIFRGPLFRPRYRQRPDGKIVHREPGDEKEQQDINPPPRTAPIRRGASDVFHRRGKRRRGGVAGQFAIQHPSQTWRMLQSQERPPLPEKDRKNAVRGMRREDYPYAHKLLIARDRPLAGGSETVDLLTAQTQAGPKKLIRKGGHSKGKFLEEERQNENFLRELGVPIPRSSYPHSEVGDPSSPRRKVADYVSGFKPIYPPRTRMEHVRDILRHVFLGKKPKARPGHEDIVQQARNQAVAHAVIGNIDLYPNKAGNEAVDADRKLWWIDEGTEGMDPKFGMWKDYRDASALRLLHILMPQPGDNEVRGQMERIHGQLASALEHISDPERRAAILRRFEELREFYAKHLSPIAEPAQPGPPKPTPSDPEWWKLQFASA